jgi:hypothetical protein
MNGMNAQMMAMHLLSTLICREVHEIKLSQAVDQREVYSLISFKLERKQEMAVRVLLVVLEVEEDQQVG